ncbi:unnamed protein product, partial [Tilletia caries]
FTDGSRIEGRVGAAAINEQTRLSSQVHLGSDQHHTVYEAELQGILLALKAAEASNIPLFQVTIAADNQAAIMALGRPPRRQSGQHLVLQIHATIGAIRTQNKWCAFRLIWCPGHEGIAANEEVDGLAKEAAEAAEAVEIGMAHGQGTLRQMHTCIDSGTRTRTSAKSAEYSTTSRIFC